MECKPDYQTFFQKIDALHTAERVALKRSAGTMLSAADGKAIVAFYHCLPYGVPPWQEERWFAIACLSCLWPEDAASTGTLESVFADLYHAEELSDSLQHRIEALMDTEWDEDGYLLTRLHRLIKLIRQKRDTAPDFAALLDDLLYWNSDRQTVQRKWAKTIFSGRESAENITDTVTKKGEKDHAT